MSEEEEQPKKKSNIVTILIFVVAGFVLVGVGLGAGFMIFGGSQNNPQDIANEIVSQKEGEIPPEELENCQLDEEGNPVLDDEGNCVEEKDPEKTTTKRINSFAREEWKNRANKYFLEDPSRFEMIKGKSVIALISIKIDKYLGILLF